MTLTNDLHIAAALAEQSYRRADADQQIQNEDIGASNVSLTAPMGGVQRDDITGFYYNNATGFVGRVVIANGKVFVAFRGTDMAGAFRTSSPPRSGSSAPPRSTSRISTAPIPRYASARAARHSSTMPWRSLEPRRPSRPRKAWNWSSPGSRWAAASPASSRP